MKSPGGSKGRPRRPTPNVDPETALRQYAVKLFDKGDGRAVDWPMVAATAFKVAFACLDEVKGDDRAAKVMRRAESGLYNRLVGIPDDGTAYTSTPAPRPDVGQGPAPHLDHDLHR